MLVALRRPITLLAAAVPIAGVVVLVPAAAPAAEAGATVRASVHSDGSQSVSPSGAMALSSDGTTLFYGVQFDDPGDDIDLPAPGGGGWQFFVKDLETGRLERVSVADDGSPVRDLQPAYAGDISADGNTLVFPASSEDLASRLPGTSGSSAIFLHDRTAGTTRRLPILRPDGTYSGGSWVQMSDDGRLVVFTSSDPLVAGDDENSSDAFLFDVITEQLTQLSDHDFVGGAEFPAISADGGTVAYMGGPLDDSARASIVVQDVATGEATRLEWDGVAVQGELPTLSGDGRLVTFNSVDALLPGDRDPNRDAYLFDRDTGDLTLLSERDGAQAFGGVNRVEISDDGRTAVIGAGGGLAPGTAPRTPEDHGRQYVYRRDLRTNELSLVSVTPEGQAPSSGSAYLAARNVSADGSRVIFDSDAPDLVAGDTNGVSDVFARTFVPDSLDAVLDGSGSTIRTGSEATAERPVVLAITPPAGLTDRITALPQPVAAGDVPSGYSLLGQYDTVLAITGPDAAPGTFYELAFTVDASLLGGIAPADIQVFRDGVALPECSPAAPPCVASRTADASGDAVVTVHTVAFSRWTVGRLAYSLQGPLQPVQAPPAVNPARAGLPVVVPFRLGGDRGRNVLAAGSPSLAGCTAGSAANALSGGTWGLAYVPLVRTYVLTWLPPRQPTGCRELRLRFRDGSELRARFQLR